MIFADLTDGLVAYYPFNDGSAVDESGNGFDGLNNGATPITDRHGNEDSAMGFDGIDDNIKIPYDPAFFSNSLTVSQWVNVERLPSASRYFFIVNAGCGTDPPYDPIVIGITRDSKFQVTLTGDVNTKAVTISSQTVVELGTWYKVSVTYDYEIGAARLYVNGEEEAQEYSQIVLDKNELGYMIGACQGPDLSPKTPFSGKMDEIRIYDRALAGEEIQQLYAEESIDLEKGLVVYYPFNGSADDESGNGNDGTVNGATLTEDRNGNVDSAYSFDGIDDGIRLPDDSFNSLTNGTISFWISRGSGSSGVTPFGTTISGTTDFVIMNIDSAGSLGIHARKSNVNQYVAHTGSFRTLENNWYHITWVKNGESHQLYINGVLTELTYTVNLNTGVYFNDVSLAGTVLYTVGKLRRHIEQRIYKGKIDDIRIYDHALSEAEVNALYNLEPSPPEPPCDCDTADTDYDGVIDSLDQCPETEYGAATYSDGCAATDLYTQEQLDQEVSDAVAEVTVVKDAIIAEKDSEILQLQSGLQAKQDELDSCQQTVLEHLATIEDLNALIGLKDQTIVDLEAVIVSMFSQEQVDQIVADACPGNSEYKGKSNNKVKR